MARTTITARLHRRGGRNLRRGILSLV
jgi:hypothetical protein